MSAVGTSVQALIQTQTLVLESLSAVQKEKDALEAQLAKAKVRMPAGWRRSPSPFWRSRSSPISNPMPRATAKLYQDVIMASGAFAVAAAETLGASWPQT